MNKLINILFVLFLWRSLTNTDFYAQSGPRGINIKNEFSELVQNFWS